MKPSLGSVVWIVEMIEDGLRPAVHDPLETQSATAALTCGVAMLVPEVVL